MRPKTLKMDEAAEDLAKLTDRLERVKVQLDLALGEVKSMIDDLDDLRALAENWRFFAQQVNGIAAEDIELENKEQ